MVLYVTGTYHSCTVKPCTHVLKPFKSYVGAEQFDCESPNFGLAPNIMSK